MQGIKYNMRNKTEAQRRVNHTKKYGAKSKLPKRKYSNRKK